MGVAYNGSRDIKNTNLLHDLYRFKVHFIDEHFVLHSSILYQPSASQRNTPLYILKSIWPHLKMELEGRVANFVTENGAKIVKAVADSGLAHVPCFAHTLS